MKHYCDWFEHTNTPIGPHSLFTGVFSDQVMIDCTLRKAHAVINVSNGTKTGEVKVPSNVIMFYFKNEFCHHCSD